MKNSKLELGKEYPPLSEASAIEIIEKINRQRLEENYQAGEQPVLRDAHAKHHGCVRAEFIVESNLPPSVKFGVFQEAGKTFTACIRFSNGSGKMKPDSVGDGRGMAVKLLGVEGKKCLPDESSTQDFVMMNHPVFFIRNVADYVEFFQAQKAGGKVPLKFFFPGINPLKWRWHSFNIARSIQSKKIASPLSIQYWSTTPYKLGGQAIKFSASPHSQDIFDPDISTYPDYLRLAMVEHLKTKPAVFDFLIQFQTDVEEMPIEDATIEWKSPFYKLATIVIPPQSFDSPAQMSFCEHLSYTPWHSLLEHQPLGAINRARKQVYESISQLRHQFNQVPRNEPTESEFAALFGKTNGF